ncbi:MAG: efflux transporter periplasmic adaptor subunit [Bacteroidetes bacterium]|nr:efflux transporter periplasmic adaptor subunit [Bacteroidota bacterium]
MKALNKMVLGIICCTAFAACSSEKKSENTEQAVKVEVYSPAQSSADGIYLSGEITAKQTASISTRMMGYIRKIYVKPGDRVAARQPLVAISSDEVNAKKAQVQAIIVEAEAAAKNAQKDYERYKVLRSQNSVSDKELENVALQNTSMQAKVQMAKQQLREVNAMLSYSNITAPFSGTVTQKMMDEGSMANPGMPILTIEQNGELQVVASVPENYIQYVKIGDNVKVDLKSVDASFDGKITELSPSASNSGGQYAMKIAIPAEKKANIRAGMYANILIPNKLAKDVNGKVMLETSSIVYREQLTGVYVVDGQNQAILHWIRLGKTSDNLVEALSGIEPNDKIISKADGKLYNGRKVAITN